MNQELPHLSSKAIDWLSKSDDERIEYIRQPRWIAYPRAKEIIARLDELLAMPKSHRMPNCLIVGDTNNGKTMLVQRFFETRRPDDNLEGEASIVPVLYVQAPPVPDEGRFYNAILERLFAPHKPSDRADRKQFQAIKLMKAVGVQMLIIDEIHHLLAGNMTKQKAFLNVIKYLGNELEVPIVAVGTRDAFRAIQTDYQLSNRFEPETLPLWKNNDEYLRLLATFEKVLPLKKPSNLIDVSIADEIYAMGEGYLGETRRVIVAAAVDAVKTGQEQINKKTLSNINWVNPSARRKEPRA